LVSGAFWFREKAYRKDAGAQAEVAVLNMALQTNGGSADSRKFVKRNVKRSGLSRSAIPGRVERREPGIRFYE
jgi:phage terminase large subunit GpA-like protein